MLRRLKNELAIRAAATAEGPCSREALKAAPLAAVSRKQSAMHFQQAPSLVDKRTEAITASLLDKRYLRDTVE